MKKFLIKLLNKVMFFFGLKIVSNESLSRGPGYHHLNKLPVINTVIDVGVGDQGSPFLYKRFPKAFFVSIDPVRETRHAVEKHLGKAGNLFLEVGLGSRAGRLEMQISEKKSRSSFLPRIDCTGKNRIVETRNVNVKTLDSVVRDMIYPEIALTGPILLKIDTEGYELECLRGAVNTLKIIDFVMLELPFARNFQGSYLFSEAVKFMAENGFEAYQLLRSGNLTADFLFARQGDTGKEGKVGIQ